LGPFDPPAQLPAGFERTALVVPTSGSTGTAKAVALTRQALLASQDATAQLFAADGTAPDTAGHGFWLPLLPLTHIAGVQVIARAHRTAQVLGLPAPALPDPLPDLRAHVDASGFLALPEPVRDQPRRAGPGPGTADRGAHHLRLLGDRGRLRLRPVPAARRGARPRGARCRRRGPAADRLAHARARLSHGRRRHRHRAVHDRRG